MEIRIAFAACIGTYHVQAGLPCQDVTCGTKWDDHGAVVLADGAGSCPHALEGAGSVTSAVLSLLEEKGSLWLSEGFLPEPEKIIDCCLAALVENPYELEEQSSTLLFALADRSGHFLCGHIGDGYIFRVTGDGGELLSDAENGDEPNETFFVTGQDAPKHLRLYRGELGPGEALLLCSDGAGEALFERMERRCAPAVEQIAAWLLTHEDEEVSAALGRNLDEVFRQVTHDDMSVAVLCMLNGEAEEDNIVKDREI